jgi:hypothetical protein
MEWILFDKVTVTRIASHIHTTLEMISVSGVTIEKVSISDSWIH